MSVILKVFDLYRNDTITMIQINVLIGLIVFLSFDLYQERKNPLSKQVLSRLQGSKKSKHLKQSLSFFDKALSNLYSRIETGAKRRLERSNLNFTVKEYITVLLLGLLAGSLIGFVIFPFPPIFKFFIPFGKNTFIELFLARLLSSSFFGFIGTFTPILLIKLRENKRKKLLQAQLIDFILSLADGIKTSRTPQGALTTVANEMPDPISSELKKTLLDIEFTIPYTEALERLAERINIDEFTLVLNAMQIQNETGGHLELMLRNMATVSEERRDTKAEVLKIVRETQNVTILLLIAPFGLFSLLFFMMGDEFSDNIFSPMGLIFLGVIGVLYIIGSLLMIGISNNVKKIL